MKKVSVIIPVYNVAVYLPECLDSVLGQTYPNLEIILIDDGSTDGSSKICDSYAENDDRIKLIHQKNKGAANAKNAGLEVVSGSYITFLDSDDYVDPQWIERMVSALEASEADVSECNFYIEYTDHSDCGNGDAFCNNVFTGREYMAQYLDLWSNSLFWNKLFKAELTEEIRFRNERRCIDDEFYTYKVVGMAKKIARIPAILYHYRQRKSGAILSNKNALQRTEDALEVLEERYWWISNRFPELKTYYLSHDIRSLQYFALSFPFTESSAKHFQVISKRYLWEALKQGSSWFLIRDALFLLKYRRSRLMSNPENGENKKIDSLFS